MHQENYKIQDDMQDLLAYPVGSVSDTMYLHQAMKQPDCKEFLNAAIRAVNSHCQLKHWKILPHKNIPKRKPTLDSV